MSDPTPPASTPPASTPRQTIEGPTFVDEQSQRWVEAGSALADATRDLVETVGLTDVDAGALEQALADVERIAADLRTRQRAHPPRARPPSRDEGDAGGVGGFVSRPTSAFHPRLPMTWDGEELSASWTASAAHEGPPGHLHGGVSAWHLDALLGTMANLVASPAVTATLELRYRRPVPVGVPLRLHATPGRITERRIVVEGTISADGEACVEGRGVFVRLDRPADA